MFDLVVVITAAHVVVHQGQCALGFSFSAVDRHLVHAVAEDRSNVFVVHAANVRGPMASRFKAILAVLLAEVQKTEAGPVSMLWMPPAFQLVLDNHLGVLTDTGRPAQEALRRPFLVFEMGFCHVLWVSAMASCPM